MKKIKKKENISLCRTKFIRRNGFSTRYLRNATSWIDRFHVYVAANLSLLLLEIISSVHCYIFLNFFNINNYLFLTTAY